VTFALRSKAWQPQGVTATEKEWLSSSLLSDLANGKLDPVYTFSYTIELKQSND